MFCVPLSSADVFFTCEISVAISVDVPNDFDEGQNSTLEWIDTDMLKTAERLCLKLAAGMTRPARASLKNILDKLMTGL
jgi:hypothetical protein